MKERLRVKCYLRYCDDTLGLARTKGEAWKQLSEYDRLSSELGLTVKASAIVAPIAHLVDYGKKKRKRKRQRGKGRKGPGH